MLRYLDGFAGAYSVDQAPAFIGNKALAFAAIALIALAIGARPLSRWLPRQLGWLLDERRKLGLAGFALAAVHSLLSLALLTPAYFDKLHNEDGRLNLGGELSLLTGVIAMVLLIWKARLPAAGESDDRRTLRRIGLGVLVLIAIHVAALGWASWIAPAGWPWGMPPITLGSFVVCLLGLGLGLLPGKPRG